MRFFLVFVFLISSTCFAQRKYNFNNLLEYQYVHAKKPKKVKTLYYFTNSGDNSYYAVLVKNGRRYFYLYLIEHDQINMKVRVKQKDVYKAENLVIECISSHFSRNDFKFRTREYEFVINRDTIINHKSLQRYELVYTVGEEEKIKNGIGTTVYIIQDSTDFHLPLLTHKTAYEEWKEEGNIPNGIFREKFFINYKNEIEFKYQLKGYFPVDKSFSITRKCLEE